MGLARPASAASLTRAGQRRPGHPAQPARPGPARPASPASQARASQASQRSQLGQGRPAARPASPASQARAEPSEPISKISHFLLFCVLCFCSFFFCPLFFQKPLVFKKNVEKSLQYQKNKNKKSGLRLFQKGDPPWDGLAGLENDDSMVEMVSF